MKNTNKAKILSLMLAGTLLLNGCASKSEIKKEETLGSSKGIQEYLGNYNGRNYFKLYNNGEELYFVEVARDYIMANAIADENGKIKYEAPEGYVLEGNKAVMYEWTKISESEYLEASNGVSRTLN